MRVLANKFDWRAQEDRFNRWPHFLTEIDGQQIHFIHARSDNPDALPLIITHGWPGSVAEFLDVIEPLRDDVPRRRAVAARLRLVGPDHRAGLGRAARRRGVGDAHGAPRLRPLRRAGRRLGRDDLGAASPRIDPEH